jgi:hypothetical protein
MKRTMLFRLDKRLDVPPWKNLFRALHDLTHPTTAPRTPRKISSGVKSSIRRVGLGIFPKQTDVIAMILK